MSRRPNLSMNEIVSSAYQKWFWQVNKIICGDGFVGLKLVTARNGITGQTIGTQKDSWD